MPSFTVVLGVGAVLLAALFYALGSIYAKIAFRSTPALSMTIGQELLAGLMMLPLTLVNPPVVAPTLPVLAATLILALVMTAGGNLLYFYLIDHVGPTKTQSVAFLIPVFALLAGVVVLGEPMTSGTLIGLGIIFSGVALVAELNIGRVRLPRPALALKGMRTALAGGLSFPATVPTSARPFRGWSVDGLPVYDRHSTRRDTGR
jgi:drug/metabolite transporter (DMT)-like permease